MRVRRKAAAAEAQSAQSVQATPAAQVAPWPVREVVQAVHLPRAPGEAGLSWAPWPPVHTTLVAVDICSFGDRRRDDGVQLHLRREMYDRLMEACAITRLPWWESHREDRGDGALVVMPPYVPPEDLLDPFAHHLTALLRRYNRLASEAARLQLRLAVHAGRVHGDAYGMAGQPLIHLFRLLEARSFKNALAGSGADLGMIVSDRLYADAMDLGGLVDPGAYRETRISIKETRARAWMWFPPVVRDSAARR